MVTNRWGQRVTFVLLALFTAGVGMVSVPRIHAAFLTYIHPPDKNVLVNRSFEPDDFSAVSSGSAVTVTIDVTNSEDVALRGFYYSDQVPNGWVVSTASVSVGGSPIVDYTYGQGYADEIYTGFTPHRWALEMPQGGGVFSPTHPIPASGGTARIVYTMIVSGGTGSDYSLGRDAWAGWLTATPAGTAVFGYQEIAGPLSADFTAEPRIGFSPLTVQFTDLSVGDILTRAWDFGDGGTALLPGPAHTYTVSGCYTVTLTVHDAYGSDTLVRPGYIRVTDVACTVFLPVVLRDYVQ